MSAESTSAAAYRVLARKYRPKTFADLIGQEALVRTLSNAIKSGRVAQAYMLTGVRGVGKTTTARLIARALNYPTGPSVEMPELTPQCEAILESRHIDVIEMDAASNTGVDNMREIIDSVRYAPVEVRTKIYIIDEVHMLSKSAFNALLKTLEEPPPHVKFIFATTEIRKVPVTILSRCQRFDLKRLDAGLLTAHYGKICELENVAAEEEALRLIARAADGSVRDGLSLLDQAMAYGRGTIKTDDVLAMLGLIDRTRVIELFEAVMAGDAPRALTDMARQVEAGGDPYSILVDLAEFTHDVTRHKIVPEAAAKDLGRSSLERAKAQEFAGKLSLPQLTRAWQMLLKGMGETEKAVRPDQAADMVLIRLAHAAELPSGDELAKLVSGVRNKPVPEPQPQPRSAPPPPIQVSPQVEARSASVVLARPEPSHAATSDTVMRLNSFADLVKLVGERRDVKLKGEVERFVRPVSFTDGRFELALEKGAPSGLPNELSRKLELWTGKRWMVIVSRQQGGDTIAAQKKSARNSAEAAAREHPAVKALFKHFPDAKISNIKPPPAPELLPDLNQDDTDEEPR